MSKNICSDDGYYTLDVRSPESAGTWTIQSASISPLHGIQMAIPQDIVRTKTFDANFHGMPKVTIIVNFLKNKIEAILILLRIRQHSLY